MSLDEIENFASELQRFQSGELAPERWRSFRLAYGIYGQRQPEVQMVRVRIPAGILSGRQLAGIADIAGEFGHGISHLTTRQDIQLHFVKMERVPELMRRLAALELGTREACGNSVRNVTACPLAGVSAEEAFDVRPYALAASAYLIRSPFCQQLARKFKIAFSACPEDCAATAIHDIGAVGEVRREGDRVRYGFRILAGGGLGAAPYVAETLSGFVPLEDLLPTFRAILKVFADLGNRRHKARARLKFVVHKLGIASFRARVAEALGSLSPEERAEAALERHVPEAFRGLMAAHLSGHPEPSSPALPDPLAFRAAGVRPHRDPARAIVVVRVPLGDLDAPTARGLADLAARFSGDEARISIDQNLVLPQVLRPDLPALFQGLAALGLGTGGALDVTSCPGADTCNLGITSSKGLSRAIMAELAPRFSESDWEALRGVTIKVSGCPNSCGQHHIAQIGLHGVVRRRGGRQLPAYQLHLGGRIGRGEARIGQSAYKIPAKLAPKAVAGLLDLYRTRRAGGEQFPDFIVRLPEPELDAVLRPYLEPPEGDESAFIDWGQQAPYAVAVGAGECAGAGADAVADPFDEVKAGLAQADRFMTHAQWGDALANLNRSQYALAGILLSALGRQPESDYETAWEIRTQLIDRGHLGERWEALHRALAEALRLRRPEPETVRRLMALAEETLAEARTAWPRLPRQATAEAPS